MLWGISVRQTVKQKYLSFVKAYLEQYGGTRLPNHLRSEKGTSLRNWIIHNRMKYAKGQLTDEQQKLLDAICIMDLTFYDPEKENDPLARSKEHFESIWMENVEICRREIQKYGDFLPHDLSTADGKSLRSWVIGNRTRYRSGKISKSRKAALESIHILDIRFKNEKAYDAWMQYFSQCKAYLDAHEGNRIPTDLKADNGVDLCQWLR